jgi:adenylate cyclase
MPLEIERKFLVDRNLWKPSGEGVLYRQGYICADADRVVRVRVAGPRAFLGVKGIKTGITRYEFEYEIPPEDAEHLLELFCERPLIEKHRHRENHGGRLWEIDVFRAENEGLVVAEIELGSEDEEVATPDFVLDEVSTDKRYYNFSLHRMPYGRWGR